MSRVLRTSGLLAAGAATLAYAAYRRDLAAAGRWIAEERQVIDSPQGPIEFAESGDGPAVLLVHGAGGGFDQGLELGRGLLGDDYRIVAPSRFGYLGTPLPDDASPEAQADAHLRLLDALQLEAVPVIGVSAGGPSAMQLCLRHPERCSALVLVVPLAWAPHRPPVAAPSPLFASVLTAIGASDFLFWTMMKVAPAVLLQTILGTPAQNYRNAPPDERPNVDRALQTIFPISRRLAGIRNDGVVAATLTRYALEDIRVPTLVISAEDDLYGTYASSFYTAEQVPAGTFIGFPNGGHLLLGYDAQVRSQVRGLLAEQRGARTMAI